MREKFASDLYELMKKDDSIILITADMGFGLLDKIQNELPNQFYNVGAAEQVMINIAVGLSLGGKIPVVYTITPFLFRAFETIRNYMNHEEIPVIMVGSGRDKDYETEGFSHDASDDIILQQFKNIVHLHPTMEYNLSSIIYSGKPVYLNLKR